MKNVQSGRSGQLKNVASAIVAVVAVLVGLAVGMFIPQIQREYVTTYVTETGTLYTTATRTATMVESFSVTFTRTATVVRSVSVTFTGTTRVTYTVAVTAPVGPTGGLEAIIVHWYTIEAVDGSEYIIWDRVSTSKYLYYRSSSHSLPLPDYATYGDSDVIGLAEFIRDSYGGYDLKDVADTVLDVVQQLHYESDIDPYAKYPIETLCEGSGDCEDLSILYASLMRALGYDVVLLEHPDHMQVGVRLPEASVPGGWYFLIDGEKYYICETTGEWITGRDWDVGECPEDYQGQSANFYRIP